MSDSVISGGSLLDIKNNYLAKNFDKYEYHRLVVQSILNLMDYPDFIYDSDVSEVCIDSSGVFVKSLTHDISIYLDRVDIHSTGYSLLTFGSYEKSETDFLKSIIKSNQIFFDVGANRGWYSLVLAHHCGSIKSYAFEPIPNTFLHLQNNIRLNKLDNIFSFNLALSNASGDVDFLVSEAISGASSMKMTGQFRGGGEIESIICQTTTLDLFSQKNQVFPDVMKIDVEGAELLVLRGGGKVLEHGPVILIELLRKWSKVYGYHPNDVFDLLRGFGYDGFVLDTNSSKLLKCDGVNDETVHTNFIFLSQSKHAEIIGKFNI